MFTSWYGGLWIDERRKIRFEIFIVWYYLVDGSGGITIFSNRCKSWDGCEEKNGLWIVQYQQIDENRKPLCLATNMKYNGILCYFAISLVLWQMGVTRILSSVRFWNWELSIWIADHCWPKLGLTVNLAN